MKTLLIDNYDSFSHILLHYLWEVNGEKPLLIRNDEWTLERIRGARFDNIVISPGPGRPDHPGDFGICAEVIRAFPRVPILGVCLGHQGLGLSAGARIAAAGRVRHGKYSRILHDGRELFAGLPPGFRAVRYHSLVIERAGLPAGVEVTATAEDDGEIMALKLADRPCYGMQFHPESIGTEAGRMLLSNFRDLSAGWLRAQGSPEPGESPTRSLPLTLPVGPRRKRLLEVRELPWKDPEAVYAGLFLDEPASFWLDSLVAPVPGEPLVTYMGAGARLIEARDTDIRVLGLDAGKKDFRALESGRGDPLAFLAGYLEGGEACAFPETCAFQGAFRGGLVGYLGYGLKRFTGGGLPTGTGPAAAPDALFLEPDRVLAFDHGAGKVYAFLPSGGKTVSEEARAWLDSLADAWAGPLASPSRLDPRRTGPDPAGLESFRLPWRPSAGKREYLAGIAALQEALGRGESYEACFTQEIRAASAADPFQVYRLLRRTNPAPYAAFLRFPQVTLAAASPERFLKLDAAGRLASRPIKGTRRRGGNAEEDLALRTDLAGNAKDHSENLMIVDLVRNDFGKVCELGSVRVPEMMRVEEHPAVFQLVSTMEGRLAAGQSALDAVRACFPGGSMTGAPKRRTMEILETHERRPRGIFSGAFGYLGCDETLDLGMVIRTLVYRDGEYSVGCGGAILAESDPENEYQEALLKSFSLLRAVELAEFGACGGWELPTEGK